MDCKNFTKNIFATCDHRKVFTAVENKRRYVLINKSQQKICEIKVDNGIIQDTDKNKCDYAFLICGNKNLVLVELKGMDFRHAIQQIISTINLLAAKINENPVSARIVLSKVNVPNLQNNPKFLKLKKIIKSKNGDLIYKSKILEEII